jgi:ribosomal protein S7
MKNGKKVIYAEIDGIVEQYFEAIKSKTGMNNANVIRYCIFETWKREVEGAPDER